MNTCKVCYRPGSIWKDTAGCDGCKGRTKKRCETCEDSKGSKGEGAPPCASCYPDRNFRWAALKTFETGAVPGRFERNESCRDCHSFLCDCGVSDYEEAIFEYLEKTVPGWTRSPSPIEVELHHQHVIKGVSFCKHCWQTLASTVSGCYCARAADCSCAPDATEFCPACCHDRDRRKEAAMEFLAAS
jgi:hypothetical protein